MRNQRSLPWRALRIWLSQSSLGTGPACWARNAVCGFILAWTRAKRAWLARDGVGASGGTEVSCWALQTLAENWGQNSPRHSSSLRRTWAAGVKRKAMNACQPLVGLILLWAWECRERGCHPHLPSAEWGLLPPCCRHSGPRSQCCRFQGDPLPQPHSPWTAAMGSLPTSQAPVFLSIKWDHNNADSQARCDNTVQCDRALRSTGHSAGLSASYFPCHSISFNSPGRHESFRLLWLTADLCSPFLEAGTSLPRLLLCPSVGQPLPSLRPQVGTGAPAPGLSV